MSTGALTFVRGGVVAGIGGGLAGCGVAWGREGASGSGLGFGWGVASCSGGRGVAAGFGVGAGVAGSGVGVTAGRKGFGFGFGVVPGTGVMGTVCISSRALRNCFRLSSSGES